MTYIEPDIGDDEETILTDITDRLEAAFPGWLPIRGGLIYILASGVAFVIAEMYATWRLLGRSIFRTFGSGFAGVQPIDATPSTAMSTWTSATSTFTVAAGTLVGIDDGAGSLIIAEVVSDVSTTDGTAENVPLVTQDTGSRTAGLSGPVVVLDAVGYDPAVTLNAATAGGIDGEDDDTYLARLSERLRLSSDDVIQGEDAAILARQVPGVWRAMAVDNYDVATDDDAAAGKIALVLQAADGGPVAGTESTGVKGEAAALVRGAALLGLEIGIADPEASAVDARWDFVTLDGWDPADVRARSEAAVRAFLASSEWGGLEGRVWRPLPTVYLFDVAQAILAVDGLDRIVTGTLQIRRAGGSWGTADVALGPKPWSIAAPGTVTATAVA